MKINNCSTPVFTGYKNVISDDIKDSNFRIAHLSMQLDDVGEKDLSEWKSIQKHYTKFQKPEFEDIISLLYVQDSTNKDYLFLGDRSIYLGNELAQKRAQSLGTVKEKAYLEEEKITLKAYTLLASLTRRLMQDSIPDVDFYNRARVLSKIYFSLSELMNQETAGTLLNKSLSNTHEKVSEFFNSGISKTMKRFFK